MNTSVADMKASVDVDERATAAAPSAAVENTVAPPLAPGEPPIDLAHLARMTHGEQGLEREVLDLFDRQADMLLARMAREAPRVVGAFAHTLAGSARGIGAWKVAEAAAAVEEAATQQGAIELTGAMDRLVAAVADARAAIAEMIAAH
jgi:HPt (histidine-containing phosphotransfer) domain-containing protein